MSKKGLNNITLPVYQEIMKELPNTIEKIKIVSHVYDTDVYDIDNLPSDIIEKLKVGDILQKITDNQKHCYIVTYKEDKKGICLSYFDGSGYMETVSYDYVDNHWVYNSKDVTQVISQEEIENNLIGKYVKIINAPTSTTLTETEEQDIVGGVFINGEFLDYKNPVLFPASLVGGNYYGMLVGTNNYGNTTIGGYRITGSHVIAEWTSGKLVRLPSLQAINGKSIPDYPPSTGSFTLKCVNGTLTWVQDVP